MKDWWALLTCAQRVWNSYLSYYFVAKPQNFLVIKKSCTVVDGSIGWLCAVACVYVCKKTNGFELINLGKFDFSSAGLLRAACRDFSRQQCHGVVAIAAVTGRRMEALSFCGALAHTASPKRLRAERAWNWINNFWSLRTSYGPLCTRIWGEYASARLLDILMCGSPLGHVDAATGRHSHRSDCSSAVAS